ncbi:DUF397 domain-containing protein [Phytohabitans sp. LJ34]|uniref:DUF397 domain-containing protein n=1 Tax=Phytohabitans sp. LJ34 TaxID=3452217 RepID=UPI003F8A794F
MITYRAEGGDTTHDGLVVRWASYAWKKSSRSAAGNGNCVEICILEDRVGIRDSKAEPGGSVLTVSKQSFASFLDATKCGVFDRPTYGS